MNDLVFDPDAFREYVEWQTEDRKIRVSLPVKGITINKPGTQTVVAKRASVFLLEKHLQI
jgi:hypothetical protein